MSIGWGLLIDDEWSRGISDILRGAKEVLKRTKEVLKRAKEVLRRSKVVLSWSNDIRWRRKDLWWNSDVFHMLWVYLRSYKLQVCKGLCDVEASSIPIIMWTITALPGVGQAIVAVRRSALAAITIS